MFSLRAKLATRIVGGINRISRLLRRGSGTVIGGRAGLRLFPRLLEYQSHHRSIVLVTGTNGKTTTTALLSAAWGGEVVSNSSGSNMPPGIVAALCSSDAAKAVLEVDESWFDHVLSEVSPRAVLLLNLSRDQLDRTSEVRLTADRWRKSLSQYSGLVVTNVRDPLLVFACEGAEQVLWVDVPTVWIDDAQSCPKCTHKIDLNQKSWQCQCGFKSPTATWVLSDKTLTNVRETFELVLAIPGTFNLFNAALSVALLSGIGVPPSDAIQRMSRVSSVEGRFSKRRYKGRQFTLALAKNPAGVAALLEDPVANTGDVAVLINDNIADGVDPSWVYDAPFDRLANRQVWCGGTRGLDVAVRIQYAGGSPQLLRDFDDLPSTFDGLVVANYTAFHDLLRSSSSW
jgi:lipid II isoglutaminyl synthase (glutamine-hydrolysing)